MHTHYIPVHILSLYILFDVVNKKINKKNNKSKERSANILFYNKNVYLRNQNRNAF